MTTEDGRRFYYVCPKCGGDVEGCLDPACREDNVGHHVEVAQWSLCGDDVPLRELARRYVEISQPDT